MTDLYFPDQLMSMVDERDDKNTINTIVCT
jgi:hypothetical protein